MSLEDILKAAFEAQKKLLDDHAEQISQVANRQMIDISLGAPFDEILMGQIKELQKEGDNDGSEETADGEHPE